MKQGQSDLPEEVFHAVAALIPRLIYIAEEECHVDPIELLVLWNIRHFGRPNADRHNTILRQSLTHVLKTKFRYSDANVSRLLEELQEKGLILRTSLTARERGQLFGDENGSKLVVVLKAEGDAKLEDFKERLRGRYDRWASQQPSAVRLACKNFLPIIVRFARWLVARYEPARELALYPEPVPSIHGSDPSEES